MDSATRLALLAGAAIFLAMMAGAAYLLLRDMRGQERHGSRIRQIHGEERITNVSGGTACVAHNSSGLVSRIGRGKGILSGGGISVLAATLRTIGDNASRRRRAR